MAVTTRRRFDSKTNVFWTKDNDKADDQIVKVHIPGVDLEPDFNIKQAMVKKPVKFRKPCIVTLRNSSRTSVNSLPSRGGAGKMRRRADNDSNEIPTCDEPTESGKLSLQKASLKDLGPEDKKRVANLVKELAKVGEEREIALTQLTQERIAFEERLQILQEEYDGNIKEKLNLQTRFLELQGLLKKYNKQPGDRNKETFKYTTNQSNHTTQTSPGALPLPDNMPGNTRYFPGQAKSPNKKRLNTRHSVVEGIQQPLISDSGCQFPSPNNISRQSTPLPGKTEGMVLPGNGIVRSEKGSATKEKQMVDKGSVVIGNGTMSSENSRSQNDGTRANGVNSGNISTPNKPGIAPMASFQAETVSDLKQAQGSRSVPGSTAGTSALLPNHATSPGILREIPTATSQQGPVQSIPRDMSITGNTGNGHPGQEIGSQLPSYHFLGSVPILPSSLLPHGSQWPPVYRHPPLGSSGQDPPVYTNRMFDVSVTNPDGQRQGSTTTTNRSQSDTSQSFSAELDAVYRLYCREYELQLQLQQQQLELQKQQLQLQQQLQQLEFFQQRQQQPASSSERYLPGPISKSVIRETPDPTPAPHPEAQPQRSSAMSSLVPTPDVTYDSHPEQPSVLQHQNYEYCTDRDEGTEAPANKTIRRITSSKRPKDITTRNVPSHEGSYISTNQIPVSKSRDNSSVSHHSLQPDDERGLGESSRGVSKQFIRPEEAARFRSSLRSNDSSSLYPPQRQSIPHSTRLDNEVDWTNATDFEFRHLQESKIREHYGLGQRSLHSSQALLDPLGPRVTGARYNLYDSATVAKPVNSRRIDRDRQVPQGYHKTSTDRHPRGLGTDRQYGDAQDRFSAASGEISDQELEQRTLQNFSLYENTNDRNKGASGRSRFYGDSNHGDSPEDIEPWVSESSGYQRERSHSLELSYPLQIIDLLEDLEDEPTPSPNPGKPHYTVYLSPPRQDSATQNGGLESTDSGFSNVSREKSPLPIFSGGSEGEIDIEELSVLEDIFFIQ